jgi:hypothetical protein
LTWVNAPLWSCAKPGQETMGEALCTQPMS